MSHIRRCCALLPLFTLTPLARAQVASALLREADPLPSHPGHTITAISNTAANRTGGYSATINTSDGVTTLSHVWGSAMGGAPGTMRTENPSLSGYAQTAFETFFGMDDAGSLSYGPTCNDLVGSLGTGLDCVWLDDTPLGVQKLVVPTLMTAQWRFNSRPGITMNGIPYWVGGIDVAGSNPTVSLGEALFVGTGIGIPLKTGDFIPTVPTAVSNIGFAVRMSALGTHYIVPTTVSGAAATNTHIVVDGQVLQTSSSTPFSKGTLVPMGSGGNGTEAWENWGFVNITESGDTLVTGDTNAATTADGFLAKNGAMVYREGQVLGGLTLVGNPSFGAYMDESGAASFIWDTTGSVTALFHESTLLLKEGDEVDWNGDGVLDADHVVLAFTGITCLTTGNSMPGGPTSALYFTADIRVGLGGPTLEGFFRLSLENAGAPFCAGDGSLTDHTTPCPCGNDGVAGHGCGHSFDASGALLVASGDATADTIVLHSSFEPVSSFTLFMQHANPGDTVFHDGVLCAGNPLIRLRGRAAVAGEAFFPNSNFAQDTTTTLSQRGGTFPGSGATMRYAAWYRNASSTFCPPATANVTNGWVVTW